jgi:RHS repeat-associated protein
VRSSTTRPTPGGTGTIDTTYGYDPLGRRVFKRTDDACTWYGWDGDKLVAEGAGELPRPAAVAPAQRSVGGLNRRPGDSPPAWHVQREYVYYPGTFVPLALLEGASSYHYDNDPNGSPTRLLRNDGRVVWSARYDVLGFAQVLRSEISNPLRLQGQYLDEETQLHYNLSRYYDPRAGQFASKDPLSLAVGENVYRYALNTLQWTDPLGLHSTLVPYGSTDLSEMAQLHRFDHGITGGQNVAVFEYLDNNGVANYVTQASGDGLHAERRIAALLEEMGVDPSRVQRIYTELAPCPSVRGMQYCEKMIGAQFQNATVTHSFEYGTDRASRRRGVRDLKKAVKKLFSGCS